MGVYIKGMDMPKSCLAGNGCEFRHICEPYKNAIPTELMNGVEWIGQAKKIVSQMQESRLETCPLIEVPTPHGRLIDEDTILSKRDRKKGIIYIGNFAEIEAVIRSEE